VSGKPVDPRFVIVHDGKAIGFCCPNCPKEFWTEPSKFAVKER
jgi:YHS domain-containing protein